MKAFTIWQPWATLIMMGAKPYEFRPRSYRQYVGVPKIGERVVIHAAARKVGADDVLDLYNKLTRRGQPDHTGLVVAMALPLIERLMKLPKKQQILPLSAGLGTVVLGEPKNALEIFTDLPHDSDRGDFNWAWPMLDVELWSAPIPCSGQRGFWAWPEVRHG